MTSNAKKNSFGNIFKVSMLEVTFFENNESNSWMIRQFEFFRFSNSFLSEKFIPRPDISIFFHFKDQPFITDKEKIQLEPFFVSRIISQSMNMDFHGTMDSFIAICKPTVFSRVFNINLSPNSKKSINLPYPVFQPLWDELSKITTVTGRINHFTSFINSYQKTVYSPDSIDIFYDKIIAKGMNTHLKDIMKECPACQRTLERNFIKRTGVSPKMLMRIVRLDYLWGKIKHENAIDYQELVFDGHYFDQAHFINDFKSIVGETPSYFFNRNLQITKMFSGRAEGIVL